MTCVFLLFAQQEKEEGEYALPTRGVHHINENINLAEVIQ
jgi:hypothetical protein